MVVRIPTRAAVAGSGVEQAVKGKLRGGVRREPFTVSNLSSFGEDAAGELYAVSLDGQIYKLSS